MLDRSVAPDFGEIEYPNFARVEHTTLKSGVPLYLLNAGEQPVVKLDLKLQSGIWYEKNRAESWFTAKMLLEGNAEKSSKQITQAFESLGAFIDVASGFDDVSISVYGLKKNFEEVILLLNQILSTPSFPTDELSTLQNIRSDELRLNDTKNSMCASKRIREALFGLDHPYGSALQIQDIQGIQREMLIEYHRDSLFNEPELFLSGQIDDDLIGYLDSTLQIPSAKPSNIIYANGRGQEKKIFVDRPESVQSSIKLAWHIPNKAHPDYLDLSIANTFLGGYFGSRLMKNIREDKGYTYGISSYPAHLKNQSFCIIGTDVKAEFTDNTLNEIFKEIETLKVDGVSDVEVDTVINYLTGSFLSSLSSPFKLMNTFSKIHEAGLGYDYYERYFECLKGFTTTRLQEMVGKYFDREQVHQVVVGTVNTTPAIT